MLLEKHHREAEQTFAIFNNCYENYGIKNAKTMQRVYREQFYHAFRYWFRDS
ncbi:MAG: hypothetical protein JSV01_10365 [Desulfobacterales bacterium]|nr:MAG: hypothetical protein JSV01_10365 [Desulfobacterales bacterium]UCG80240.1 MAG: hypothetical protein JSV60_09780 [Desulfobacterales bacterium]